MLADVAACVTSVEAFLDQYLASLALPVRLDGAVRYALLNGGKRLRPILAWKCAQAVGGDGTQSIPAGAAVELVHAFSLVHDDLPAMDNDDMRRGRPTLHIHAGEAMAILAGDAMMTLAFRVILDKVQDAALGNRLTQELASATTAMIVGQVHDTMGVPDGDNDLARLRLVHTNKTGALICCACRMGAMCAHADEHSLRAITNYAQAIGLMFQIVDDLMDVEQSSQDTGKRTGKDAAAGKLTYPSVLSVEGSRREVRDLADRAMASLEPLDEKAVGLGDLCHYLARRTN